MSPGDVVVVGDTPHDVAAAHVGGVACLAVATGRFSSNGATRRPEPMPVLPDLSSTDGSLIPQVDDDEQRLSGLAISDSGDCLSLQSKLGGATLHSVQHHLD